MKTTLIAMLTLAFFCASQGHARGGGRRPGGGGGHVGGGYRPSRPSNPAHRPTNPGMGHRPGNQPIHHPSTKPGGTSRPGHAGGPGGGNYRPKPGTPVGHPGGRPGAGDVGKFLGGHPAGHFPGSVGHRPGYQNFHKAEMHTHIHNHFPYHPVHGYPFSGPWLAHWNWHYSHWPVWTVAATASTAAAWIGVGYSGYGAAQPIPYYPVEPAPIQVYNQQVAEPAKVVETGKETPVASDAELMNLGTFGLIPFREKDLAYGLQLTMTKQGIVRGIQWDMNKDAVVEMEGAVDPGTLKIAWQAKGDANALMFESNVDQLTQQESLVNVYDPVSKALVSWQVIQIDEKDLPKKP